MKTGQLIKDLRVKRGITQDDLAAKADTSVRTIQRIENDEVDPRSYTLRLIADALEVDYELFVSDDIETHNSESKENEKWIPLLHLSGLLITIAPPIIIWILKRNEVEGIRKHAIDVINYQLSISLYLLPLVMLGIWPLIIILFVYSQIMIIVNTIKVTANRTYKYPLNIKFIKPYTAQELSVS